jgi:hypothetical protein
MSEDTDLLGYLKKKAMEKEIQELEKEVAELERTVEILDDSKESAEAVEEEE